MTEARSKGWAAKLMAGIGPGLFIVGYNIGTGSVTTMTVAGADYGLSLLWMLIFACAFTAVMVMAFGKYTAVTGQAGLEAIRKHLHPGLALFMLIAMGISILSSIMGVMSLCAEATAAWIKIVVPGSPVVHPFWPALGYNLLIFGMFLYGNYSFFEKVLALFVGLMGLSFITSLFIVIPGPEVILQGLVPRIPEGGGAALVIAGMVGTTLSPVVILGRSLSIRQKGWTAADVRMQNRDAVVSSVLIFIICGAIMACAAGTMYYQHIKIHSAIDMMYSLVPLTGSMAVTVFTFGFLSAGLSSQFPNSIFLPWCIRDWRGEDPGRMTAPFKALFAACLAVGFAVPVFGGRPVLVMIASQAFQSLCMPALVVMILILLNRRDIMGEHKNGPVLNIAMLITLAFSIVMGVLGFVGLRDLL